MEKIAGGSLDSAIELGKELCKKYGVPDEDWEALFAVISDEDHQMLVDEFFVTCNSKNYLVRMPLSRILLNFAWAKRA